MSDSTHKPIIKAPEACFTFLKYCFVSKPEHVKGDWVQISSLNVALLIPVKYIVYGSEIVE